MDPATARSPAPPPRRRSSASETSRRSLKAAATAPAARASLRRLPPRHDGVQGNERRVRAGCSGGITGPPATYDIRPRAPSDGLRVEIRLHRLRPVINGEVAMNARTCDRGRSPRPADALPAQRAPLAQAQQLIAVTTRGWTEVPGTLQRYERKGVRASWQAVGTAVPIVVGRNGLGWGRGVNAPVKGDGPVSTKATGARRRASSRSRARSATHPPTRRGGSSCRISVRRARMSASTTRRPATTTRPLERATVVPDWHSSEIMRRADNAYRWGVIVAHNMPGRAAGGSCIFLHIWSGPTKGTAGCTAMAEPQLLAIMPVARSGAAPTPGAAHRHRVCPLRSQWTLP